MRKAYSLVELSVVIIVIAIILSFLLISRSIVNNARINAIQSDANSFQRSIRQFIDQYECRAGDCSTVYIPIIANSGLNPACVTQNLVNNENGVQLLTGNISTTTERTCMMYTLQLAGYITGVDTGYNVLTDSIAGRTIPKVKGFGSGAWDYRYIPVMPGVDPYSNRFIMPPELGLNTGGSMSDWLGRHVLLLRDANQQAGILSDASFLSAATSGGPEYGISSYLAAKLDFKFDDGKPYTGNIIAGMNLTNWNDGNGPNSSCNTAIDALAVNGNVNYLSSMSKGKGCLVGFMII